MKSERTALNPNSLFPVKSKSSPFASVHSTTDRLYPSSTPFSLNVNPSKPYFSSSLLELSMHMTILSRSELKSIDSKIVPEASDPKVWVS